MLNKVFELTEIKLDVDKEGTFEAVFATLDAIDSHGDTYDPGAIGEQDVVISQWNHGSWSSGAAALPVGIGKVFERGNKAIVQGEFDMDDPDAVKTYRKLKYLHSNQRRVEWSFALPVVDRRYETRDGQEVRVITRVEIPEVSPVLLGAGVDTQLLAIKGKELDEPEGKEDDKGRVAFAKQLDDAVVAVESVIGRAKQVRNLRREKGKNSNSRTANRRLKVLHEALLEAAAEVEDLLVDPNDEFNELAKQFNTGGKTDVETTG